MSISQQSNFTSQDFQANFITSAEKRSHCLIGQKDRRVQYPFPMLKGLRESAVVAGLGTRLEQNRHFLKTRGYVCSC